MKYTSSFIPAISTILSPKLCFIKVASNKTTTVIKINAFFDGFHHLFIFILKEYSLVIYIIHIDTGYKYLHIDISMLRFFLYVETSCYKTSMDGCFWFIFFGLPCLAARITTTYCNCLQLYGSQDCQLVFHV